jgi:hypothetical protein
MGDRAGATESGENPSRANPCGGQGLAGGTIPLEQIPGVRINCAGLAGKPAPSAPPKSFGADGSFYKASPRGTVRKYYRTPSSELDGWQGSKFK